LGERLAGLWRVVAMLHRAAIARQAALAPWPAPLRIARPAWRLANAPSIAEPTCRFAPAVARLSPTVAGLRSSSGGPSRSPGPLEPGPLAWVEAAPDRPIRRLFFDRATSSVLYGHQADLELLFRHYSRLAFDRAG